jgi:hypothetical protein
MTESPLFFARMALFGLEKRRKQGVTSYYLINRIKLQDVDSETVRGNWRAKYWLHRGRGGGG